jgi:4-alpha-glucanotransferase
MPRPQLRALAAQVGILPSYVDQSGRTRLTGDETRVALLAAMGIAASSEAEARDALADMRAANRLLRVDPVRVADARAARQLAVCPMPVRRAWSVEVTHEDGARVRISGRGARRSIMLPRLPLGYHRVRIEMAGQDGDERVAEQRLIVVPSSCPTPRERLGSRRVFGLLANLYTLRSTHNWGFGDLSDLQRLVEWAGQIGAAFVGVNPLHALDNRGDQISPYSPLSRLYRNVLYLDATAMPEWADLSQGQRRELADAERLSALRRADRVDYGAVRSLKWPVFVALHRRFAARHRDGNTVRGRTYAQYLASEGDALRRFAAFAALREHFEQDGVRDWRRWPAAYRDSNSESVRDFVASHREAIDLHCYLQFELDRQLGAVAETAQACGAVLGVYQDLALGSSRRGSDPWAYPGLFLDRVDVGAPPDNYSPTGQNWALPAVDPRALRASGYDYWIRVLRAALRHAGALRIDHVLGLVRQYWIPTGSSGADGAYVRFPTQDLLGILALESRRAGALVIGEDLGTVPRGLSRDMERWSLLSTRVLYFERTRDGGFRSARSYPRRALVGANTHDLAPLAGFWEGRDLLLRRRAGLLPDDRALAAARRERERERRALLRRLRRDRALTAAPKVPGASDLRGAVHAFLAQSPAVLVGVSLDDLSGERVPVNVPGVPLRRFPSWSRRMRLPIESLADDLTVARALDGLPRGARSTRKRRR